MAAKTDQEHVDELRTWRDNIVTALKAPETVSAFGGQPDTAGGNAIGRMGGRAQLLRELADLEDKIKDLEERIEDGPYLGSMIGVT